MDIAKTGFSGAIVWATGMLAAGVLGCVGGGDKAAEDAGHDAQSDVDAGADTGVPNNPSCNVGLACRGNADCRSGFCEVEVTLLTPVIDLPNGDSLETSLFPGGACSPTPFTAYDSLSSCDISAGLGLQGCGECGVCIPEILSNGVFAMCREACEPEANGSGCSRAGYTCDFAYGGCVEGCRSDEECRVRAVDSDLDGELDAQQFDPTSSAICDPTTFRCSHDGTAGAQAGDPCNRDGDCEADGRCIVPQQQLSGYSFPGGYCSKRGCDVAGLSCAGSDSACVSVRGSTGTLSTPQCMLACQRGAEADPAILGADGHGEGCRVGYRCAWDGVHGVGPVDNGVCVGGNYNNVTVNNIGAACSANSECFSPYGQGQCLRLSVGGISAATGHCTIMDCAAPGTPDDLCGEGNECIGLARDSSFCVQTCAAAEECAEGLACADDDDDPTTGSICYPTCIGPEECRQGESCVGSVCRAAG